MQEDDAAGQAAALEDLRFQATRLARLVSDLLAYSRLDDKAEADTEVDTRQLLGAIIASLPRPSGLEIDIVGDWPSLRTAEPLLDLVLRNLIDNAIKHHDTGIGTIEVRGALDDQAPVVDDGPRDSGAPPRRRSRVVCQAGDRTGPGLRAGPGHGGRGSSQSWRPHRGRRSSRRRAGARIVVTWLRRIGSLPQFSTRRVIKIKGRTMVSAASGDGGDFLVRRNVATLAKASLPKLMNVLIVEDECVDARRIMPVLRIMLGRDVTLRLAPSLDKAIDEVLKSLPDALFLDDYLKPNDSAL
jgi:hypothetical protein